ncbi:MAG: peptidoglycan recognition family protein, partial [Dehalococcoidia bacterium]|nr:peptidoglycan recognition family protein [Dehalococcoidia bacterium]
MSQDHSIEWIPAYLGNFIYNNDMERDIRGIVIHDLEGSLAAGVSWFANPASDVSAHYLVAKDGHIVQMVSDNDIAFHATGTATMLPPWLTAGKNPYYCSRPNAFTLGIEAELLATDPDGAYTDAQLDALRWL